MFTSWHRCLRFIMFRGAMELRGPSGPTRRFGRFVAARRIGEPSAFVAVAVGLLVLPPMIGAVAPHLHVIPSTDPGAPGPSCSASWVLVLTGCLFAIVVTACSDRSYPRRWVPARSLTGPGRTALSAYTQALCNLLGDL